LAASLVSVLYKPITYRSFNPYPLLLAAYSSSTDPVTDWQGLNNCHPNQVVSLFMVKDDLPPFETDLA
jgi:hypothetical protein